MKNFDYYRHCFANLHTAKSRKFPAPHKPLLLISVIDLIGRGLITSNRIELTDVLIETFNKNTKEYLGNSVLFTPKINCPFYHLKSEPFWELIPKAQSQRESLPLAAENVARYANIAPKQSKPSYSLKALRENFPYALIDPELFNLLQNQDARATLKTALITQYLNRQPNTMTPLALVPTLLALSLIA